MSARPDARGQAISKLVVSSTVLPSRAAVLAASMLESVTDLLASYGYDVENRVLSADVIGIAESSDWDGSLIHALSARRTRLPVMSATTICAAHLDPAIAAICEVDPALPWLLMIQLNLLEDGAPIIYSHDYHRGDRFSLDVLRRTEQAAPRP